MGKKSFPNERDGPIPEANLEENEFMLSSDTEVETHFSDLIFGSGMTLLSASRSCGATIFMNGL
jgi:hypothetical protein